MSDNEMDEAFEAYRRRSFGAYAPYPVEAYTYFCVGWKAAIASTRQTDALPSPIERGQS